MESQNSPTLKVVMLPWLAYGHISPFLELAKRLSDRNIQSHLCSTPVNLDSIRNKIPGKFSTSIHLVEFHLPACPQLPPQYQTTNGLPPHLNHTLKRALDSWKPEFSRILEAIRPDLVIHDIMLQWAASVASADAIPAVAFLTSGAAMCSYYCHFLMKPAGVEYPFPGIRLAGFELDMFNNSAESYAKKAREQNPNLGSRPLMTLIKSSRAIEGDYIDYLSELMRMKIMPIGTLVCRDNDQTCEDLMEWLGKKDKYSTVFVSFGSEYFLKREEIEEIAVGLELSKANFIWVIRFPTGEEIPVEEVVPEGFLGRVGERGRVLRKWAPQGRILGSQSVGGFVSHCGWGSLMECIEFGVPIIAMPMHLDQPLNGKLVEELGVGVGVDRDENGRFVKGEIGRVIMSVLDVKNGEILRENVGQVREVLKGTSEYEFGEFVDEIVRLCGKSR